MTMADAEASLAFWRAEVEREKQRAEQIRSAGLDPCFEAAALGRLTASNRLQWAETKLHRLRDRLAATDTTEQGA